MKRCGSPDRRYRQAAEVVTRIHDLFATGGVLLNSLLSSEQRIHVLNVQKYGQDCLSLLTDMQEFMTERGHTTETESRHARRHHGSGR